MRRWFAVTLVLIPLVVACVEAAAASMYEATLVIQGHRFVPANLKVPAGRKIKLTVVNKDATPEEFESYALKREKIVPGNGRIVVVVGPLKAGEYPYFGEFNPKTAQGALIAE